MILKYPKNSLKDHPLWLSILSINYSGKNLSTYFCIGLFCGLLLNFFLMGMRESCLLPCCLCFPPKCQGACMHYSVGSLLLEFVALSLVVYQRKFVKRVKLKIQNSKTKYHLGGFRRFSELRSESKILIINRLTSTFGFQCVEKITRDD